MKMIFTFREKATKRTYRLRIQPKQNSKTAKNGRMKKIALSEGECPALTGLRKEAQSTGVRINATTTESSMEEITVTENWR